MNPDDNDAWDLATLAAQLLRRRNTPAGAVKAALELLDAAKHELAGVQLKAWLGSPEAREEQEKQMADYLAGLKLPYGKGVKIITSQDRRDRALKQFKKFLTAKAEKERAPKEREAWVEAKLSNYEVKSFTGTEAKKLKTEFEKWRQSA
jgi:cytochrome P450